MDADASAYKFIVDRMLGRLVAWLRIFGYDTKSALDLEPSPDEDTTLIKMAKTENRILVSGDRGLVDRAKKAGLDAVLANSNDVRAQLEALMKGHRLNIDPNMTRCTACNAMLHKATESDMERIRGSKEVHEHVLNSNTEFWVCDKCGKVYWQGSHWRNILKTVEDIRNSGKQQG